MLENQKRSPVGEQEHPAPDHPEGGNFAENLRHD
jgi:hypothetical protein